jgi:hypothetical protein
MECKMKDLALGDSALVQGDLKHLSFDMITTGDIETCVIVVCLRIKLIPELQLQRSHIMSDLYRSY